MCEILSWPEEPDGSWEAFLLAGSRRHERGDSWGPRKLEIQVEGPSLSGQNKEFAGVVLLSSQGVWGEQREEKPGDT